MTNQEVLNLYNTIAKHEGNPKHPGKFKWAIMRTKKKLKDFIEGIQDIQKPEDDIKDAYEDYNKDRVELCKKYAVKDDKNKPVLANGNYVIDPAKLEQFNSDVDALADTYPKVTEFNKKAGDELKEMLEEPAQDTDFYKVKYEDLPEDISAEDLGHLEPMIDVE